MPNVDTMAKVEEFRRSGCLDGRPFTALLQEDISARASALSMLLLNLPRSSVRVVQMGNSVRSRLTLEHNLLQVTKAGGDFSLADNARRIARTMAERRGHETSVVLLITQAETLHSRTLQLLQEMAPYFAEDAAPTLQVVFVGRPAFRDLLRGRDLTPLREALGFPEYVRTPEPSMDEGLFVAEADARSTMPTTVTPPSPLMERTVSEPVPRLISTATHGRLSDRLLSLLAVIAMGLGTGYLGVRALVHQDVPALPLLNAVSSTDPQPASNAPPSSTSALPYSTPDALPPTPLTPVIPAPAPALAIRPVPFKQRSFDESALANPAAMPNPRVVIHVPAGSETSAALSIHLLASLGSHPGTVELRRVAETPTRPNIRYFHPGDELIARQIAAQMTDTGLIWTLRDFSTFLPRPSRGTIEIWLPRL